MMQQIYLKKFIKILHTMLSKSDWGELNNKKKKYWAMHKFFVFLLIHLVASKAGNFLVGTYV